jgi:hypothetical protein
VVSFKEERSISEERVEIEETKNRAFIDLDPSIIKRGNSDWTADEVLNIFKYFKLYGTKWSKFVHNFPGRNESNLKNKFYSTLKKVATRAQLEDPKEYKENFIKSKNNLVQFVDIAMKHGLQLSSKRGRKRNIDRLLAPFNTILFHPKSENAEAREILPPMPEFVTKYTSPIPCIKDHRWVELNSKPSSQVTIVGILRVMLSFYSHIFHLSLKIRKKNWRDIKSN